MSTHIAFEQFPEQPKHRGLLANEARILGALTLFDENNPPCSSALRKQADELRCDGKETSHGALMRAAERLEELGWVTRGYVSHGPHQRPLIIYKLTEAGQGAATDIYEILGLRLQIREAEETFLAKWKFPALAPNATV